MWVARFDPAGRRMPNQSDDDRYVEIGPVDSGLAGIWAQLRAPDGAALDQKLDALAATVCRDDPRTKRKRRAGALGALAAGLDALRCECGSPDCAATSRAAGTEVVIHVLAEQAAVAGESKAPAYLPGYGPIPAAALRELAVTAKLKPLTIPSAVPEHGYRPSTALAEFVRLRDLTCRFPGCDKPAAACQIDHTVPYPLGPTHPSNLKLLCVFHHLLKTFYTGVGGWADRQQPDGTVIWTAPSGQTYTTTPTGSIFFPIFAAPTGKLLLPSRHPAPDAVRGVMMPRRKRTRAAEHRYRITWERRINEERLAQEHHKHAAERVRNDEPPPF